MRRFLWGAGFFFLTACASVDADRGLNAVDTAIFTRVTFEPLDRKRAELYLQSEQHVFLTNTKPMQEQLAALEAGRAEKFSEVRKDFPECDRQRYCASKLSKGEVKRFELYTRLVKEIAAYDKQIIELRASINEWTYRKDLRERAIYNRFVVHEMLELPKVEPRFQKILAYSLEHFPTRKLLSQALLRFAGDSVMPKIFGDYNYKMAGRLIDEAAVIAAYEVSLTPDPENPGAPIRFLATFLVNSQQRDLWFYDIGFLRAWGEKLAEPFQKSLREDIYCGLYSVASDSLAPQFLKRGRLCGDTRQFLQSKLVVPIMEKQIIPLALYVITKPGEVIP